MDGEFPITDESQKEENEKIMSACAGACGVGRDLIEKIASASEEQKHRMDNHIQTGSYMMQMVLHYEGNLNESFLLRVLSAMRLKNHILRTRLINYEGFAYQLVLKDEIAVCQQLGADVHGFLARDSQTLMDYGTPLFRYAFIKEPLGETFFIWTSEPLRENIHIHSIL